MREIEKEYKKIKIISEKKEEENVLERQRETERERVCQREI